MELGAGQSKRHEVGWALLRALGLRKLLQLYWDWCNVRVLWVSLG